MLGGCIVGGRAPAPPLENFFIEFAQERGDTVTTRGEEHGVSDKRGQAEATAEGMLEDQLAVSVDELGEPSVENLETGAVRTVVEWGVGVWGIRVGEEGSNNAHSRCVTYQVAVEEGKAVESHEGQKARSRARQRRSIDQLAENSERLCKLQRRRRRRRRGVGFRAVACMPGWW